MSTTNRARLAAKFAMETSNETRSLLDFADLLEVELCRFCMYVLSICDGVRTQDIHSLESRLQGPPRLEGYLLIRKRPANPS